MNEATLTQAIRSGIDAGILPPSAANSGSQRPWALVALSMVGVWLAALPLICLIGIMVPHGWSNSFNFAAFGTIAIVASLYGLHERAESMVAEQLCFIALLVGWGLIAFAMEETLGDRHVAAPLALLTFALAFFHSRHWLHVVLGAVTFALSQYALLKRIEYDEFAWTWLCIVIPLAAWIGIRKFAAFMSANDDPLEIAATLDVFASGWGAILLLYLMDKAGQTFLLGSLLPADLRSPVESDAASHGISLALAALACMGFQRIRPALPKVGIALVVPVLAGLSWLIPSFSPALLMLVACVQSGQRRLATGAGVACAWSIGTLYYSFAIPLTTTAMLLLLSGIMVAGAAWQPSLLRFLRGPTGTTSSEPEHIDQRARYGILLSALLVFGMINTGIWQKERTIAKGKPIFVELAPADPRSLMQGDFMRLRYRMPPELFSEMIPERAQKAIGTVDAKGILHIEELAKDAPLKKDQIVIELLPERGNWIIATDAWYFTEGEGKRWEGARYGEFRVMADGKAVLVGLKGEGLKAL
jgi:uncharacterized membrane-anchored protein